MSAIESVVLQLASTDLDSADSSSKRNDKIREAKDLVRDASVRRQLPQVSTIAVQQCTSFSSYERVLIVLATALFHETSTGASCDKETIASLANQICFLICSSSAHFTPLLRSAEAQLVRVKHHHATEAFETVAPENIKAGYALAIATSKTRRKSAVEEQHFLANNRARRKTAPLVGATGGPEPSMTLMEKDEAFQRVDGHNEWDHENDEHALLQNSESPGKSPAPMNVDLLSTDCGTANEPGVESVQIDIGVARRTPVAVLVSGSDDEASSIHAVECDPGDQSKILQNHRFRLYGFLALLFVALFVTLVTKFLTSDSDSGYAPTPSPTSVGEVAIRNQLLVVVSEDKLADETTPEAKAAYWIINEDPLQLTADSPRLIQRFVLAVFYISTTQESKWLSCNRPEVGQESKCNFKLMVEAFPFMMYEEIEWYRWLSEAHECDWAGLFCDETDIVRAIELWGQEMSGTLPAIVKELPYLQSIVLIWNNFYGTLPKEWAELKHLLNIELHYNWLEGEVPGEWWETTRWSLQKLNIAVNQFSGTVPTEIGGLSTLKGLFLFENQMTGTIPAEVGMLRVLAYTRWGRNFLGGTLPTELGRLLQLQELWLHRNNFEGTIPTEIGQATALEDLRLHYNPLNGTIPIEIYSLARLFRLDVYNCDLTGTIPTEISRMSAMEEYRVRDNNLHGTIPTEIGLCRNLKELWLHRNDFTGSIPTEVCGMKTSPQDNGLYMIEADCLESTTDEGDFDDPMVFCPQGCCTRCCDRKIGTC